MDLSWELAYAGLLLVAVCADVWLKALSQLALDAAVRAFAYDTTMIPYEWWSQTNKVFELYSVFGSH